MSEQAIGAQTPSAGATGDSGASTPARSSPSVGGTPTSTPTPPTASPSTGTTPAPSPQPSTPQQPQLLTQQQQQQLQQQVQQQQLQQTQQQVLTPINITPVTISSTSSVMATSSTGLVSQAIRASLPQGVQVIQGQFIPQQAYIQQQLMFQNAAAVQAAMQAQAINPQLVQARQTSVTASPKNTSILSPQTSQQAAVKSTISGPSTGNGKAVMATGMKQVGVQQQVAAPMIGGKPIMQRQNQQPLVIGQLAGFPIQRGQGAQAGKTGVISSQPVTTLSTQSKTCAINPSLMSQSSLIGSQLRISSTPTLVTNTGQLINTQGTMIASPAMINQLAMASNLQMHQALMAGSQGTTVLNNQPVYIRTTTPITPQQAQLVSNIQQLAAKPKEGAKVQPSLQPKVTVTTSKTTPVSPATSKPAPSSPASADRTSLVTTAANKAPVQQRQINRVTGVKKTITKTIVGPVQVGVQARPMIQPKPSAGGQPTMVVTPKFQQTGSQPDVRPVNILPKPVSLAVSVAGQSQPILTTSNGAVTQASIPAVKTEANSTANTVNSTATSTANGTANGSANGSASTVPNTPLKEEPQAEPMEVDSGEKEDGAATGGGPEKQKAIVKPHILTHFIEGFVIQEAAEPFQVQKSSLLTEMISSKIAECEPRDTDNSDFDKDSMDEDKLDESIPTLKCEFCGKVDYAHRFRRSKRFCSMACAKRYNVGCSKRLGLFKPQNSQKHEKKKKKEVPSKKGAWKRGQGGRVSRPLGPIQRLQEAMLAGGDILTDSQESEDSAMVTGGEDSGDNADTHASQVPLGSTASSATTVSSPVSEDSSQDSTAYRQESPSQSPARSPPRSPPVLHPEVLPDNPVSPIRRHPSLWNVMEVYEFIRTLEGCTQYADEFKQQEIDGQALMLLREDHLMSAMNMKLGPALKICSRITSLKDEIH